jgi:phosphoribosyl 1,2-cyclic phosphate phosphodiesterase
MLLTFLGTGTSKGVPVIGCECPVCRSLDPHNRRTRTSALLRTRGQHILIDAGPDFRAQALSAHIGRLDAVLLTHSHFDHIGGIDDLRPLTSEDRPMPIYGDANTIEDVRHRFSYAFSTTASEGSSRPALELRAINGSFNVGDVHIVPLDIIHGGWTITGYRIGRFGYVTDASAIPPASFELLQNLDVLVLNALRFKPHPTHFSLDEALKVVAELAPRRAFFVHMTHHFDHTTINAKLPCGVELAYDGLEVEVAHG